MTWRNLRAEISEMFTEYSQAEAEPVSVLLRHARAVLSHRESARRWYARVMADPVRRAALRAKQRAKKPRAASVHTRCEQCNKRFQFKPKPGPRRKFCARRCAVRAQDQKRLQAQRAQRTQERR